MQTKSFFTQTRWLVTILLTIFCVPKVWSSVGDAITAHGNIADATVYYLSGQATVSSKTSTYYCLLASDGAGASITGNATTTKANGTQFTFLIESGTYYLVTPNGYYVEPHASSNGKLVLTAAAKAVTVSTVSSKIRITGTTTTTKSIQKNKTTAANFGSYSNTQNDLTLYVAGYRVIYDKNGATGGTVPTDATVYGDNATATIKANTGSLVKTGYTFAGWNTAANGSGTDVAASGSATRTMTAGLRLYAKWTVAASCSADVAIGTASLNGTFNLTTVGVQCASITVGSNCAVAANNYGFIWYEGTGDKVIGGDGVTRVNNSTAYSSSSFSNTLSSTFTAGTTYTFRAFAINDKPSTAYSAAVSFTPYTVTFNMNGHGSAPTTQVVNSGGTASTPSAPSATGYDFGGWYQESGCTNSWNFSTTITSENTTDGNRNLYAKWTAKIYAITLNGNSATSAGSPASVNATYNSSSLSSAITNPSRTGYTFGGWNTKDDGTGLTIINTSGNLEASQSGYTDGSGNWTKDGTATLYAKWTAKSFTVTWMVNGESYSAGGSTSVNFDSHVTTLPTPPTPPCGDKFMGWTTVADYVHGTSPLFTAAGDAPTISAEGDVTYYAVFADYAE